MQEGQYYPIFWLGTVGESSVEIYVQSNVGELNNKFTVAHNRNVDSDFSFDYFPSLTDYFNSWMNVSVTFENGIIKVYYNGVPHENITDDVNHGFPICSDNHNIHFGWQNSDWNELFFKGSLDNVTFWNRALSQNEIQSFS